MTYWHCGSAYDPLYDEVYRLRSMIGFILQEETPFISPHTRDMFDRYLDKDSKELWEGYKLLRDGASNLMDIHRANVAEKTNRIIHTIDHRLFYFSANHFHQFFIWHELRLHAWS